MNDQQRAAMQMALDWVDWHLDVESDELSPFDIENEIRPALREALAQPQGEWVDLTEDEMQNCHCLNGTAYPFALAIIAKFKEKNTPPVVPQVVTEGNASEVRSTDTGEPVARIVRYIGQDPYPGKGYTVARTYAELPENTYPDHWEEGAKLYITPPSVEAAIEATKEKAAKVCENVICYHKGVAKLCAAAIRSMK